MISKTRLFGRPVFRSVNTALRILVGCGIIVWGSSANATESGTSVYLLGTGGPGAAIMPPLEGIFVDNTSYLYDGSAGGSRDFILGGNVASGLEASAFINITSALWVPSTSFAGGTLALGMAVPVGGPSIDASAVISGPRGNQVGVSAEDSTFTLGDPLLLAALGWKSGKWHFQASTMVNIPVGDYDYGELANISFNRWASDFSLATSWHDPESGWDISAKAGVTFNGTNKKTDYDSGTEFHLEGAIEKTLSPHFSLGVIGYHFEQLSGDSGDGAALGSFRGRVTALGGTAATHFKVGPIPMALRLKVLEEFNVKNRMKGTVGLISLAFPISVKMPPGRTPLSKRQDKRGGQCNVSWNSSST
ncbi:transporter [Sphingomonas sp. HDW15A]|uniref:SphA family protein n=1 Tax=Sphingomonas sp. HDW15A TaxID=2714942 RepID=UPI00140C4A8E|nr:transporter [Sphingomonas sp. HDW15A]QIK95867.1 transporter [Sphingomonas sp. HDW15A]